MKFLLIDSGTTSSRVRLAVGDKIVSSVKRAAGAKDVSITGSSEVLRRALKEAIEEILKDIAMNINDIDAIIAAGMISSNVGLYEIPQIAAPIGPTDISQRLVMKYFPDIIDKPIIFIPGVKTGFDRDNRSITEKDVMRGEETEIFGYMGNKENEDILFMHYGSHHKCILLSDGKIAESRTSITGELLMSIAENTILKSSLVPLEELDPSAEWFKKGIEAAEVSGFGRALFSTRVLQTMEGRNLQEATSFYLGTLCSLDLSLVSELMTANIKKVVLYGKELFPKLFKSVLEEKYPNLQVEIVPEKEADLLSAKGAVKIYKQWLLRSEKNE